MSVHLPTMQIIKKKIIEALTKVAIETITTNE